jgi:hypothetical protein
VKCFKYLILLLVLISNSYAKVYQLRGIDDKKVTIGDIVSLKVADKEVSATDLGQYKNKRISELLYVLDIIESDKGVFFKVIIAEKSEKEKVEIEDVFKVKNVNFEYQKIKLEGSFKTIDENITLQGQRVILIIVILFLFAIGALVFIKLLKKKKRKKINSQKRSELNLSSKQLTRKHLENIYLKSSDIQALYSYKEESLLKFQQSLNDVQYKKIWSGQEYEEVCESYREFLKTVKDKNGV